MDSQTIKDGAKTGQGPHTVTLAGQEIVFTNLQTNFASITNTGTPGKTIKTLDNNKPS